MHGKEPAPFAVMPRDKWRQCVAAIRTVTYRLASNSCIQLSPRAHVYQCVH